jgi:Regulator of RNA terminal phosphate cyclase
VTSKPVTTYEGPDYNALEKMTQSFLQRLFGKKKQDRDAQAVVAAPSQLNDDEYSTSPRLESQSPLGGKEVANCVSTVHSPTVTKRRSLFAFVDLKDPFMPSEIGGEDLPGPILSIMNAMQFESLLLFHTPHAHTNALATQKELSERYPGCKVVERGLPVSDPKDYSSLIVELAAHVRQFMSRIKTEDKYACVSSGTTEMRAAWFLLAAIGVLPAKLLQVDIPARHLFGQGNVREVFDTRDWREVRHLLRPPH